MSSITDIIYDYGWGHYVTHTTTADLNPIFGIILLVL